MNTGSFIASRLLIGLFLLELFGSSVFSVSMGGDFACKTVEWQPLGRTGGKLREAFDWERLFAHCFCDR
jgi:hypothetical protein